MKRQIAPNPDQGALLIIDDQGGLAVASELLSPALVTMPLQRQASSLDWSTSSAVSPNGRALLEETGGAVDLNTHYVHLLDSLRSVSKTNSSRGYLQVQARGNNDSVSSIELGHAVSGAEMSQRDHFFIAQGLGAIANTSAHALTPTQSKARAAVNDLYGAFQKQFVTPTPPKERRLLDGSLRPDQVRSRRNAYMKRLEGLIASSDGSPVDAIALQKVRYCPKILSICAQLLPAPK
jgi:hypothetical protein